MPFFFFSDAILNISGLTVFKQEAPSPTEDGNFQNINRQNHQNPPHSQAQSAVQQNNNNNVTTLADSSNTNLINTTLHQLLGQNGYTNLENVIEGIIKTQLFLHQDVPLIILNRTSRIL